MNPISSAKTPRLFFAALLVFGGLLTITPANATAVCDGFNNGSEDFEDYQLGLIPPTNCLYTNASVVNGSITPDPAGGSNQVWYNDNQFYTNAGLKFNAHACSQANAIAYTYDFRLDALPGAGGHAIIGLSTGANPPATTSTFAGISVAPDGTPKIFTQDATTNANTALNLAVPGLIAADTWYTVALVINPGSDTATPTCNGDGVSTASTASVIIAIAGTTYTKTQNLHGGAADEAPTRLAVSNRADGTGVFSTPGNAWLDNLTIDGYAAFEPGSRFCANVLDEPEFGYEYTDGLRSIAEAEDDGDVGADLSMDDGFFFSGSDEFASWDMTAKHFTTGSKAFHVFFQIEAATDLTDSTFRVAFTLNNAAVPDGTNRGNGLDTLLFDDQYEVQFRENGNDWQIQLFKAEAGGSRASQGPAVNTGNPNNPEVYSFWLDTRATHNYAAVKNSNQEDIINTTESTVPNLPTSFSEDTIYNQWFLGYGSGQVGGVDINQDADTELNDNKGDASENSGDSTCVYDDVGTGVVGTGGSGTAPGSSVADDPDTGGGSDCTGFTCVPSAGGLSSSALALFLGIVVVAAFAASMAEGLGGGAATVGVFAVLGLVIAYALGYVELWVLVILAVVGVAAIFMGFFRSSAA